MSLQICSEHNQVKDFICAKNQCNQLICQQCFKIHADISKHSQAVKLSLDSRQFFLRWTEFILQKLINFSQIVTHMGYSKIFEMKLQLNHPKGTVSQLNFQEIQKIAIQALQQHRKITEGNLSFIKGTQNISEMIHPQFLKDLYNIACEDARFNLENLLNNMQRRLIQSYPNKQIYKFAKFNIFPKQILQIQDERKKLVRQFEQKIILRAQNYQGSPSKTNSSLTNSRKKGEKQEGTLNEFTSDKQRGFSKDYHSSSQTHLPELQSTQLSKSNNLNNPSTLNQIKQQQKHALNLSQKQAQNPQKGSLKESGNLYSVQIDQLKATIKQLRSNQITYQQKLSRLQRQNQSSISQLKGFQKLQKQRKIGSQQKLQNFLNNQIQTKLKNQILQLQKTQVNLSEENLNLNRTLKDLQDLAQGRSRTITSLEDQIKRYQDNIQLKQKSIKQLNQLISNQEQQIAYRQNESQILEQQIKKLMDKIKFLQESIHQLNNLISNQEQQISYRQNEVQTLDQQINRLLNRIKQLQSSIKSLNSLIANQQEQISYRQNQSDILEKQVKKLLQKISYLQKSIRGLNNLISNQEEEISYRQNQSQTLTKQVKNLIQTNKYLENQLNRVNQSLSQANNSLRETSTSLAQSQTSSADEQLLEQVVLLEADIQNKNDDIQLLIGIAQQYVQKVLKDTSQKPEIGAHIMYKLKGLKTISVSKDL